MRVREVLRNSRSPSAPCVMALMGSSTILPATRGKTVTKRAPSKRTSPAEVLSHRYPSRVCRIWYTASPGSPFCGVQVSWPYWSIFLLGSSASATDDAHRAVASSAAALTHPPREGAGRHPVRRSRLTPTNLGATGERTRGDPPGVTSIRRRAIFTAAPMSCGVVGCLSKWLVRGSGLAWLRAPPLLSLSGQPAAFSGTSSMSSVLSKEPHCHQIQHYADSKLDDAFG